MLFFIFENRDVNFMGIVSFYEYSAALLIAICAFHSGDTADKNEKGVASHLSIVKAQFATFKINDFTAGSRANKEPSWPDRNVREHQPTNHPTDQVK